MSSSASCYRATVRNPDISQLYDLTNGRTAGIEALAPLLERVDKAIPPPDGLLL